jgi:hypothetical protein
MKPIHDYVRQGTVHRPQCVLGFERRRLLALPCRLERLMVDLRADRQLASSRLGRGARLAVTLTALLIPGMIQCE